ncbi:hypothetical protein SNEBB_010578 [Seison nebaliae]|nr:hypothetical protein SNEBB_010578 [Seison nebaliae]
MLAVHRNIRSGHRHLNIDDLLNLERFRKSVLLLRSNDVFTNLAMEHLLFSRLYKARRKLNGRVETKRLSKKILLLYVNRPCIVIGRHQNIWREIKTETIENKSLPIVRRHSGGGTVYHDEGNLCLSFLGLREDLNRKENCQFLQKLIRKQIGYETVIGERHDIFDRKRNKLSGSAAKINRLVAYHHLTLLINSSLSRMMSYLHSNLEFVADRSTRSIASPVTTLSCLNKYEDGMNRLHPDDMICTILRIFFSTSPYNKTANLLHDNRSTFVLCNEEEKTFDCFLNENDRRELEENILLLKQSVYSANPLFTIQRTFKGEQILCSVKNGRIVEITNMKKELLLNTNVENKEFQLNLFEEN